MANFSVCDDEKLVEVVSKHPIIYDASTAGYKDAVLRENIWKEIGENLNKKGDECKKRWKTIRDSFFRCRNKEKRGTGSAAVKATRWHLYEKLKFLIVVQRERDSLTNVTTDQRTTDDTETTHSLTSQRPNTELETRNSPGPTQLPTPTTSSKSGQTPKSYKRKRSTDDQTEILKLLRRREERRQNDLENLNRFNTPIESFGEHVKTVLNSLPPKLMIQAKGELLNVLSKYEFLAAESAEMRNSPATDNSYIVVSPASTESCVQDNQSGASPVQEPTNDNDYPLYDFSVDLDI